MSPMMRMDRFSVLMDQVEIPCERPLREQQYRAQGRRPLPNCEGKGTAEWLLRFKCGCPPGYVLYCTFCKDAVLSARSLYCEHCKYQSSPGEHYSLIEPLNRSAA